MSIFEKQFWELMNEFTDLQQQRNKPAESPWHRKPMKQPKSKNQHMVADRYKGRYTGDKEFTYQGELNDKIESIRNGKSTYQVLSKIDVKHILDNYSTKELPKDKPKRIFAGVVAFWDPMKDSYILKKADE